MKINIEKKELLKVAIYFVVFFLCAFLGARFWPNGIEIQTPQPVEIQHSPDYYDIMRDDYEVKKHIDEYINALENRIAELEGHSFLEKKTLDDFLK